MPDEIDALERGGLEPTTEPAGQAGGWKPASHPWQVKYVHSATFRQRLDHRPPPAPGACQPVHQNDRLTFAGDPTFGRCSVDHELSNFHAISVAAARIPDRAHALL